MKTLLKITGILLILAVTGCSSAYRTTVDDDIYYSPTLARVETKPVETVENNQVVVEEARINAESHNNTGSVRKVVDEVAVYEYHADNNDDYYQEKEGQVIINNYYHGDYYDYSYAARIRRFHRPYASFHYYDPFFTNMFFYTYDPMYYGVSIYMGYGAAPFYYPGYFMMSPWHWHSRWHWAFHPSSYWMWGWRYPSYWAGFHYGFHSGLYAGLYHPYRHYGYVYNSHDGNSYHYGPRGSMGSTVDRSNYGRRTSGTNERTSFAERFEARTRVNERGEREILSQRETETRAAREATIEREPASHAREAKPEEATRLTASEQAYQRVREHAKEQERTLPSRYATPATERATASESAERQRERGDTPQRYARPQQVSPQRQSDGRSTSYTTPRTYTAPSYQQPSEPQRARPSGTAAPASQTRPSGEQARPAQPTQRPSAQPSRTDQGRPSYSPPRQQPSRTTTSPSRSSSPPRSTASPTRSSPSRSSASPARSTPSRSSASPARSTPSRSSGPARSSSGSSSRSSSSSDGRNR